MLGAASVELVLNRMSIKAPIRPSIAPEAFNRVIFSRIKIADRTNTKIGDMVTITDELIGVDRLKPLKNPNIFIDIPNTAQAINLGQSRLKIGSDFTNILINQNRIAAPKTLSSINPKG